MKIRSNTNIKKIVIHHTGHTGVINGTEINTQFLKAGAFGAPYDVMINFDGSIDATARWVFAGNGELIERDINPSKIFSKYRDHHFAGIGTSTYREKGFHIACVGNFDQVEPSPFQLNALISLLTFATCAFKLNLFSDLEYFSEVENTSSPGVLFFDKQYFLFDVNCKEKTATPFAPKGFGDDPYGGDDEYGYGELF